MKKNTGTNKKCFLSVQRGLLEMRVGAEVYSSYYCAPLTTLRRGLIKTLS